MGTTEGSCVGNADGIKEGMAVEGTAVGSALGNAEGESEGILVEGDQVGATVGSGVGALATYVGLTALYNKVQNDLQDKVKK